MKTITTEVYTLDELVQRGDERAVERALEWMQEAWAGDTDWHISEVLTDALSDAFGKDTLTWDAWDYYRGYVSVSGSLSRGDTRIMEEGPLAGLTWPGGDLVDSFDYGNDVARDYGRIDNVWLWVTQDGPSWIAPEYDALCDEVADFVREVEQRLTQVMRDEYEYLTSREYLMECALANEYTFTADGKRFG